MRVRIAIIPKNQVPRNRPFRVNQPTAMICFEAICFHCQHAAAQESPNVIQQVHTLSQMLIFQILRSANNR